MTILASREAILAPRDHIGGPLEQQDGHEVVGRFWSDFEICFVSVCGVQNALKFVLFLGLFPGYFLSISNANFRR